MRVAPVFLAVAILAACAGARSTTMPGDRSSSVAATPVGGFSNVSRGDYIGSAACASCHPRETDAWRRSPMHRMTRDVRDAEIRAPFDGTRFPYKNDAVVLDRRGADRMVQIESSGAPVATYRVTRVIGGRTREDFAGIEVGGSSEEMVLPISFVYATGALRYKGYSVMVHERATLRAGPVWSRTCIFCHNTVPEVDRLLGAVAGPRPPAYQGVQVDRWLPDSRRTQYTITDGPAFASAIGAEEALLGGVHPPTADEDSRTVARGAIDVVRSGFDGSALVEAGVGCEACHGGSREHARAPRVRPSFAPRAPWLSFSSPTSGPAADVNRVCARCHQVLFSRYPFTWEGGRREIGAGGSHISSGEARDFLLGGCADQMACTTCHDPHRAGRPDALAALVSPAGNGTCTRGHH